MECVERVGETDKSDITGGSSPYTGAPRPLGNRLGASMQVAQNVGWTEKITERKMLNIIPCL